MHPKIRRHSMSLIIPLLVSCHLLYCSINPQPFKYKSSNLARKLTAILNLPTNLFYLLDSVLALPSDNFPPFIPLATLWWHFHELSSDAIFIVCSQTFTLFRLIKTAVPVKISLYSFRVFSCACPSVISSISGKSFRFPFPYFVISKKIE